VSVGIYFIIDVLNAHDPEQITLATATSTFDLVLLDFLLPNLLKQQE